MKLNSEECEGLLSSGGHHVSPGGSLPRSKSDLVDMAGDSSYSPTRKSSKSDPLFRVHCIPFTMVLVFFVLWMASSEVKAPDLRTPTPTTLDKAELHLKVINNEIALPGSRTVLYQDELSHTKLVDPSLPRKAKGMDRLSESYIRGNAR